MEPGWVPPEIDTTRANIARVYDYWLGGSHNFLADQDVARAMIAVDPNIRAMMRANRAFLGRAVRYLAREAGIRQFLDIGSGIPTEQNVHEVAQAAASGSRIVYVDNDEVAVAHSRLMLEDNPDATVIQADLREPDKILADPETQLLIDFTQPVALLLLAVLHFVPDAANPAQILATLRDAVSRAATWSSATPAGTSGPRRRTTRPSCTTAGSRRTCGCAPARRSRPCSTASPWWSRGWYGYPNGGPAHPPMCRRTRSNSGPSSAWPGATPDSPGPALSRGAPPG